jgi:hypothetical protein
MASNRVEIRVDDDTLAWLKMRANSAVRPRDWKVQDEIREMLKFYQRRDSVNGLRVPR